MRDVFICDAARTAIGRYGGALAKVRTDDLAAVPIRALVARNRKADWSRLDEVFFGCANQAGEDNRNVARMALLLAGLPDIDSRHHRQPAVRVGAQCGGRRGARDPRRRDGFRHRRRRRVDDARAVRHGQGRRGVFAQAEIYDTTLGWRFINPLLKAQYGVDSMPETGENVAEEFQVARKDQDAFALRSQQRAGKAQAAGYFAEEIVPVEAPGGKAGPIMVDKDEHPRPDTTLEELAKLKPFVRNPGTITAGNASGVNDGAAAIILASEDAVKAHGLTPRARVLGMASAGGAAAHHGHRPGAVDQQTDGAARAEDRRLRPDRAQRSVRLAGHRLSAPARRCRTMPSTSIRTAAPSRSAIRSACRARGSR